MSSNLAPKRLKFNNNCTCALSQMFSCLNYYVDIWTFHINVRAFTSTSEPMSSSEVHVNVWAFTSTSEPMSSSELYVDVWALCCPMSFMLMCGLSCHLNDVEFWYKQLSIWVPYIQCFKLLSRIWIGFSHYCAILVDKRKSKARQFARFSDLLVWSFSSAFQQSYHSLGNFRCWNIFVHWEMYEN